MGYFYGFKGYFEYDKNNTIHWPNNRGPPKNRPTCGFLGDAPECQIEGKRHQSKMLGNFYSIKTKTILLLFVFFSKFQE